jgi:hypothetical protein
VNGHDFEPEAGRCPVCQARFRGASTCSRCGADLMPLMLLAAQSYCHRQSARQSLRAGDTGKALAAAKAAQKLHRTPQGGVLEMVCAVAVGNDRFTSAAASPPGKEVPRPAGATSEGGWRRAPVNQEISPFPRTGKLHRLALPAPASGKALCLGALAALVVATVYLASTNRGRLADHRWKRTR